MILHVKDKDAPVREISIEQAKFEFKNNIISRDALCWKIGMKEWVALDLLPEMHDRLLDSPKETKLNENWLFRQIDARRSFGDTGKLSSPTAKEKWLYVLSLTGLTLVYIFAFLLFISTITTRDQNHNPFLGFLFGLILFRRIFRLQSESIILKNQIIKFPAFYLKSSFLACLKWFLYLTPVYIVAVMDAETASDFGKNMGKSLGLYICTIACSVDAPLWVWRKRNQFSASGYPKKNLAWAYVGGIGLPLSLIYLFAFFIPAFQNSMQRAQAIVEAAKFPKPRSAPTGETASSPSEQENIYSQNEEKPISKDDIDLLKAKAEEGDVISQFNLGVRYNTGKGAPKDSKEAVKWYRMAAEQGLAKAQYNLGLCYRIGEGVAQDAAQAAKWYRMAAEQGLTEAQYNLGALYNAGEGVTQNSAQAAKWTLMAASQGYAKAQYNIGLCYANGEGVPKDSEEAAKWYRMAAEQGHIQAQYYLGLRYALGKGAPKDSEEASKWFRMAAEQGLAQAQYNLGVLYNAGEGVANDAVEAAKWFRMAAEQGHAEAQFNLGLCYRIGGGVAQDAVEAAKWFRIAAEKGLTEAQYYLGFCYTKGEGVAQDSAQAAKWFRKAAEQGQVQAQYNLGVCYHKGKGVAKDHVEAYAFFSLAAERLEQSRKALALLKKDMSSIQVAKGERRANELQSQISAKVSKPAIE